MVSYQILANIVVEKHNASHVSERNISQSYMYLKNKTHVHILLVQVILATTYSSFVNQG